MLQHNLWWKAQQYTYTRMWYCNFTQFSDLRMRQRNWKYKEIDLWLCIMSEGHLSFFMFPINLFCIVKSNSANKLLTEINLFCDELEKVDIGDPLMVSTDITSLVHASWLYRHKKNSNYLMVLARLTKQIISRTKFP